MVTTFVQQPNGVRLSCGAEFERSQIKDYHIGRGAGSFRRWLGCAPTIIARFLPSTPWLKGPRHRFRNNHRRANGPVRTTLGSYPCAAPAPRRDLHCNAASRLRELARRMRTVPESCLRGSLEKMVLQFSCLRSLTDGA